MILNGSKSHLPHFYLNKIKLELMNWREFLKPNKKKIIISLIITLVWYLTLFYTYSSFKACSCSSGEIINFCIDYEYLSPLKGGCHCGCTSLQTVVYEYLYALIIPFIIAYVIMSLREKKK